MEPDQPMPETDRSKEYEKIHNWLFLAKILLTVAILAAYMFSGLSAQLTEGLTARFDGNRWLVNGAYILISLFGFSAILFPLSCYTGHTLETHYGLSTQSFSGWLGDYFKSMLIDAAVSLIFFEIIYALLAWLPDHWWLLATGVYILFGVILSLIAPTVIMPLFEKFEPLKNRELTEKIEDLMQKEGIRIIGVYTWGLSEKTVTGNAAFTGLGKTRRIILSDTILKSYSDEEILAVLAHEVGHYRNKDLLRLLITGSLLAFAGFKVADLCLTALAGAFSLPVDSIATLPLMLLSLLVFSVVSLPLSNLHSRRREYAADAYAVKACGSPDPLVSAFEKLADQNLTDKTPHPAIEFLLHSHPSIGKRIEKAREKGVRL